MRRIGTFLLLVILIITSLLCHAAPAMAAGITLYPTSGVAGTTVTVTGYSFSNNETGIYVLFDSIVVSPTITATGTSWTATFVVPSNAAVGTHQVTAYGATTTVVTAVFTVTAQAAITLNPSSGSVGTSVTVSGAGFAAGETGIKVLFDGAAVVSNRTASATGAWSATFNIPTTYSGSHTVDAAGSTTLEASVTDAVFTVEPQIAMSKTSGGQGNSVTITGSGFAASESGIRVTFDGTAIGSIVRADAKGSWSSTFTIPATSGGDHVIGAYGSVTPADSVAQLSYATGASISINKNSGAAGTSVTVTGTGFASGESGITITFDGAPLGTATAGTQGSWTASIVIPESPAGTHVIDAYGPTTQANSVGDVTFTTGGGIAITPTSGSAGSSVSVSGYGFAANERSIAITYDGAVVASNITANPQGQWTGTFTVPASAAGSHRVGAYGAATRAALIPEASFTIGAGIALNKSGGAPGSSVTVTGSGFGANEKGIAVTYDGVEVAANITADARGAWTSTFVVPASMSGRHIIDAHGTTTQASQIGDLSFSTTAGITATPTSGSVGTRVTLSGFGFAAGVPLKIKYDNTDLPGVSASTNAAGELQQVITIPKSTAGSHSIRVIDPQNNEYKVTFEMESLAPASPRLLSPEDGSSTGFFKGAEVVFRWNAVSDPSGVSYVLQVNDKDDFQQPLLEKTGIISTSYTPTASESLKEGTFYWRVKAIDGASNESEWSQTWVVKPGAMAMWSLIVIILAALLIIAAGVYFFLTRRRTRRAAAAAAAGAPPPFTVPGMERVDTVQGQWRPLEPELPARPRGLPFRLALPQAPKGSPGPARAFSPEEQARMKVIANFAQSLPLAEPAPEAGWLLDLAESSLNAPLTPASQTQLLEGNLSIRYDPAWMRHPLYEDMTVLLRDHPVLQELKGFVDAVNLCATESSLLLREIYRDAKAEISPDILKNNDWDFVSAVYSDAMSWYLGKSLQEPSERDYMSKPETENADEIDRIWLWGSGSTVFNFPLLSTANEEEYNRCRGVHIRLRRSYRNSQRARQIASMITQLEVQRSRLISSFSQFASAVQ